MIYSFTLYLLTNMSQNKQGIIIMINHIPKLYQSPITHSSTTTHQVLKKVRFDKQLLSLTVLLTSL